MMSSKRNIYLQMKSLAEARDILFNRFNGVEAKGVEMLPVPEAVRRILAEPVTARTSSPGFHSAAMDGIAVRAANTFGAHENAPKIFIANQDAFYVNTGHVLPSGTDAVIMIENIQELEDGKIRIEAPAFPWQNVRKIGEDIVATELLFPRNHQITPFCIGALLSGGIFSVPVRKKPLIAVIPTGSELVDWRFTDKKELEPGQVFESNSYVLMAMAEALGARSKRYETRTDDIEIIKAAAAEAAGGEADMVLILGGSSAGSRDYAKHVISELGEILLHGVTMMPGKPIVLGVIEGKPVFGIPGYPVSAILAFEQFVGALICRMLGQPETERQQLQVELSRKVASKLGVEEFLRVKLGEVGGRVVATPLSRGAGTITSLTRADGIIRIPNHIEGLKEQVPVTAELLKPLSHIRKTIVSVGSHDNTLDVLADELRARFGDLTLSSSHVGSMGGIMAVKKGGCHIAGTHLLDTTDGSYNVSYIKKHLSAVPVRLIHLVLRDQGLMVPAGNPKSVCGIADLCRKDIRFINRQAGSGTRILLDFKLNQLQISPDRVCGYDNEEFTHMSVAAGILSGAADVGLGIMAAANALGLDFIPVVTEQYDLIIPAAYFDSVPIQRLLETISADSFKQRVAALGGYNTENTGREIKL
ncbi:MAG: molybdopterin biosynthesis protein [Desulfobacterales bacterium]|nr:molybdopterin biosynthesis protein [Desulfobacterales bacterium]